MKSRRNSSALQAAARRRWKRLPPEERLVFVDIELAAVGRRRGDKRFYKIYRCIVSPCEGG